MGILEIISAIVLIVACVFIVLVVLMQDTKQGMSQTITGGSADNYYQRNSGRSNEAKLNRLTKIAAVISLLWLSLLTSSLCTAVTSTSRIILRQQAPQHHL